MADQDRRPEHHFAYGSMRHEPMDVDVDAEHDPERAQRVSTMLLNREQERYTSQGKISAFANTAQELPLTWLEV